jgi:VWFA-related protein
VVGTDLAQAFAMSKLALARGVAVLLLSTGWGRAHAQDSIPWSEQERAFFEDGAALLIAQEERDKLLRLEPEARRRQIEGFLARDPQPDTAANELRVGIAARQRLAFEGQVPSGDVRFLLRFLHGSPSAVQRVDCGEVFVPSEVWTFAGADGAARRVVLFRKPGGSGWELWRPADGKPALYTEPMRYWLSVQPRRIDTKHCAEAKLLDEVTGIKGLGESAESRKGEGAVRGNDDLLAPPADLAAWAARAAIDAGSGGLSGAEAVAEQLPVSSVQVRFPAREGGRMVTEIAIELPVGAAATVQDGDALVRRLSAQGVLERRGEHFEDFRLRFRAKGAPDEKAAVVIERRLRPGEAFVARIWLTDDLSGRRALVTRGFLVPSAPESGLAPLRAATAMPAAAPEPVAERAAEPVSADAIALVPPTEDAVAVTWRTVALTTGQRIRKVAFFVDGARQLTVGRPPFSAELRLTPLPTEQLVRAEGLDETGTVVATAELLLNPRDGRAGVRIVEPAAAVGAARETKVRLAVTVPNGRLVRAVELRLNERLVATLRSAPWEALLRLPAEDLVFLVAEVILDDGTGATATRTLRSSGYIDEVNVESVELYLAVRDGAGEIVRDLRQEEVSVLEAGKAQVIQRFEWVKTLPLRLGVVIDCSGSMSSALAEAQGAAQAFLRAIMKPGDQAFLESFSGSPTLDLPLTDDTGALIFALNGLRAQGPTALHDALVQGLRQLAGTRGQRALVLLADGEDNASAIAFEDALEYARRSGTAIYTIGLDLPFPGFGVRQKLQRLAEETGGQAFIANRASELDAIYATIEEELRSRYLIVYQRDSACGSDTLPPSSCPLELKLRKGVQARVTRVVASAPAKPST